MNILNCDSCGERLLLCTCERDYDVTDPTLEDIAEKTLPLHQLMKFGNPEKHAIRWVNTEDDLPDEPENITKAKQYLTLCDHGVDLCYYIGHGNWESGEERVRVIKWADFDNLTE